MLAQYREEAKARMRSSRHTNAPCFTYLFALKNIAVVKVGISIDPLDRICKLPEHHLAAADVFDLERSIAVCALHRKDAREIECTVLKNHAQ